MIQIICYSDRSADQSSILFECSVQRSEQPNFDRIAKVLSIFTKLTQKYYIIHNIYTQFRSTHTDTIKLVTGQNQFNDVAKYGCVCVKIRCIELIENILCSRNAQKCQICKFKFNFIFGNFVFIPAAYCVIVTSYLRESYNQINRQIRDFTYF